MQHNAAGIAGHLPGGAQLAPGETELVTERFMLSTFAFYLHTQLVLTNRRLYALRPSTLLGLIPVGTSRVSYPIENIAGVSAITHFAFLAFLAGGVGVLLGVTVLSNPNALAGAIFLFVVAGLVMLSSWRQAVEVLNSGGGAIRFPVSLFERSRTVDFANRVSEALARMTTRAEPTHRSPAADPSEALRQLNRLRDEGLISKAEYDAKRNEILSRL